jgi:hypothetical protein
MCIYCIAVLESLYYLLSLPLYLLEAEWVGKSEISGLSLSLREIMCERYKKGTSACLFSVIV